MTSSVIVVVGNDAHFGYLMQRYISQSAYRASFVNPGLSIQSAFQQEMPSAIILEITSPGMEEISMLHALKTNPATCEVPVVICSWHEELLPGEELADAFLSMPVLYEEFVKTLADIGL